MKTDELIDQLGRDVTVARPLPAPGIRTALWTVWAIGYLVVFAMMMFAVVSSAGVTPTPLHLVQQGAALVTGIIAARAALASVIPGAGNRVWAMPAVSAGVWGMSLLCLTRPHAFALTVLLWHGGTIAAVAALCALIGGRWLRWPTLATR